jgi:hypothetical protein
MNIKKNNLDYGRIHLEQIINASDFWSIIDMLKDDNSDFIHNRNIIVDTFKNNTLFGLRVIETNEMYKRETQKDSVFWPGTFYLLPCFCIENEKTAIMDTFILEDY